MVQTNAKEQDDIVEASFVEQEVDRAELAANEITQTPALFSQNTFKLAPSNLGKYQICTKELVDRGMDENNLRQICSGQLDKLRALPRAELEYIRDNAENLVLVYQDQMNFRNDIARGGKVITELFKITGQVGFAEKVANLNVFLVDENIRELAELTKGGNEAMKQNLDQIENYSTGITDDLDGMTFEGFAYYGKHPQVMQGVF